MPVFTKFLKRIADLIITSIIWIYFTLGFLVLFSPVYLVVLVFARDHEISFQRLNNIFYKSFFFLIRALVPGLKIDIHGDLFSVSSSVIICNHLSYLDPILLISLFPRHRTIVKGVFFNVPVFGSVLKFSGYIPSSTNGSVSSLMVDKMQDLGDYLSSGGNLFIFPEGTRSRNGRIGRFHEGGFKIARRFNAPIKVLRITNTHQLFPPGKFLFNSCMNNTIKVRLIGNLDPDYESKTFSISDLIERVRSLFEGNTR